MRAKVSRMSCAVRPLRIHVDQAHLNRGERMGEFALRAVALVVEPLLLRAPVHLQVRLPDVRTPAGEAEGLEAHGLERDVAGQHDQVGPRQVASVLLLDRPQQPPRLVEIAVVGPAVERREALRAGARAAAPVGDAVGAGRVPGHADEQRAVVAVVGRPPVLRVGHQRLQVGDDGVQIELLERLGVVERLAHRVGLAGLLVQDVEVQLVGPPVGVTRGAGHGVLADAARERTLGLFGHG
jgi:hypothetical protein